MATKINSERQELLQKALSMGEVDIANRILDEVADVNILECHINSYPTSLIAWAAEVGVTEDCMKILLEHGALAGNVDSLGVQPISYAARNGNLPAVRTLLPHSNLYLFSQSTSPILLRSRRRDAIIVNLTGYPVMSAMESQNHECFSLILDSMKSLHTIKHAKEMLECSILNMERVKRHGFFHIDFHAELVKKIERDARLARMEDDFPQITNRDGISL